MQEIFQPTHQEDQFVLYLAIVLALTGLAGLVVTLRKKGSGDAHNRNMLVAMLLFFLTIISTGTALFSWLSMRKTGPVTITDSAIETPYGKVEFKDVRNAEIIVDRPVRLLPTNSDRGTVKLLIIEERSGKAHVMSEENYDIQRIFGTLREAMK